MHSIDQILTFPTGTNCTGLSGRITQVGKRFSGTSTKPGQGPSDWSFQDITLDDGTGQMVVCLDKRQELATDWVGAWVEFHAGEHQNKPCGLIAEDHTRKPTDRMPNPQPIRRVRVTPSARGPEEVQGQPAQPQGQNQPQRRNASHALDDYQRQQRQGSQQAPQQRQGTQGGHQPQQRQPAPPQHRQNTPQGQPQGQRQPQNQGGREEAAAKALRTLRLTVARVAYIKRLCYDAAAQNAHRHFVVHGVKISQEGVGAESNSLFIDTMRHLGHSDFDLLPYHDGEFKGRPLVDLYDEKRPPFPENYQPGQGNNLTTQGSRAATKEEMEEARKAAEYERLKKATAHSNAQVDSGSQDNDGAQWPEDPPMHSTEENPNAWREGLDGDDIPF